jgi:hypothetical protein
MHSSDSVCRQRTRRVRRIAWRGRQERLQGRERDPHRRHDRRHFHSRLRILHEYPGDGVDVLRDLVDVADDHRSVRLQISQANQRAAEFVVRARCAIDLDRHRGRLRIREQLCLVQVDRFVDGRLQRTGDRSVCADRLRVFTVVGAAESARQERHRDHRGCEQLTTED